eukprot:3121744-Pleurochrysis_carterae.AAC.6
MFTCCTRSTRLGSSRMLRQVGTHSSSLLARAGRACLKADVVEQDRPLVRRRVRQLRTRY